MQNANTQFEQWLDVAWPVLLPALWAAICWTIAALGGWRRVAKQFAARHEPPGTTFRWMSLGIKPCTNYNLCIHAVFAEQGLYLRPIFLFRIGHHPLLIPWEKVGPIEEKKRLITLRFVTIRAAGKELVLLLPRKAAEALRTRFDAQGRL